MLVKSDSSRIALTMGRSALIKDIMSSRRVKEMQKAESIDFEES
jgi:hypothetical protein